MKCLKTVKSRGRGMLKESLGKTRININHNKNRLPLIYILCFFAVS